MSDAWQQIAARYAEVTDDVRRVFLHPAVESAVAEDARSWSSLLDYGCGPGELTAALAPRFGQVVAVDSSATARQLARQALGSGPEVLSPEAWRSTSGRTDVALLSLVLTTLPRDAAARALLAELAGRLTDSGRLFVATTHPCFTFRALSQVSYGQLDAPYEVPIGPGLTVQEHHRPLSAVLNAVADSGLCLVRAREVYDMPSYYLARSEAPHRFAGELPMFLILTCRRTAR